MSDNIWGPYQKQPQVFLGGHAAVFTGPDGKEWFSYRGEAGGKPQGRLCVDPVPFAADGSVKFINSTENSIVFAFAGSMADGQLVKPLSN